jgi:hypothetical protein
MISVEATLKCECCSKTEKMMVELTPVGSSIWFSRSPYNWDVEVIYEDSETKLNPYYRVRCPAHLT